MKINLFLLWILKRIGIHQAYGVLKSADPLDTFESQLDVPYIDDGNRQHMFDIYYAKENRKNIVILDIHGGSYMFGDHRNNYPFGFEFVKNGYDFISLDYVPNNGKRNPKDSLDDLAKNLEYIFSHKKELRIENEQFVITGDSAGGHFALTLAEALCNKEYQKELGYDFGDEKVLCCLVNCLAYDFVHISDGYLTKRSKKRMFGPNYSDPKAFEPICPRIHLSCLTVPLFASTCKNDFLRIQTEMLQADMKDSKLMFELVDIDSDEASVGHVHNIVNVKHPLSLEVDKKMMEFIEKCRK